MNKLTCLSVHVSYPRLIKVRSIRSVNRYFSSRKGFGSFHVNQDIEDEIRFSDKDYLGIPEVSSNLYSTSYELSKKYINDSFRFGKRCKIASFILDTEWTFINHGAFGASLYPLLQESTSWRHVCDSQPLLYFDRILLPTIVYVLREMSKFLNCPPNELYPLQNATSGLNSIINSVEVLPGDEIVCFSLTYGSTKKILQDFCIRTQTTLKVIDINLPLLSEYQLLNSLEEALNLKSKLIIIDQITSNTAITLPILAIAKQCRKISPNIRIVVDAAHSLLAKDIHIYPPQVSYNTALTSSTLSVSDTVTISSNSSKSSMSISSLVDVWITNGHKWFCAPKGCAFMWVNPTSFPSLRPSIISHGYTPDPLAAKRNVSYADPSRRLSAYAWDGCRDYSALLTVPTALRIWKELMPGGVSGCRHYMSTLMAEAVELALQEWDLSTDDLPCAPEYRSGSCMTLVPLPDFVQGQYLRSGCTDNDAFALQELLHHEYRVEVPVKCIQGRVYVRLSAHIYNSIEDFERLVKIINSLR